MTEVVFHRVLKQRRMMNNILSIEDVDGQVYSNTSDIGDAFVRYFCNLLGRACSNRTSIDKTVVAAGPCVPEALASDMCKAPTEAEIKLAFFSIPESKAPGPDGYGSGFFRYNWDLIRQDIILAVQDFFRTGSLLKQVNTTLISLIPKSSRASKVSEFRPISCCNILYKAISKIICNRMKLILPSLVNLSQSAFIEGRQIIHNVLLAQDLFYGFKRKNAKAQCIMKVDLQKAYDSLQWDFIEEVLVGFRFPEKLIGWIMQCIRSPSYSIVINGGSHGFFKGRSGLRQGDPISPLIFVLCMEYLSRLLGKVGEMPKFNFYPRCKSLKLNHLCFADDLLLFAKADKESIALLLSALHTFSCTSGLKANATKSEIFICGIPDSQRTALLSFSQFQEGTLPVRYLGVPLSHKKLGVQDCEILVDKMVKKIHVWKTRNLSYQARSVLIQSVLMSLQIYWASIFIIPRTIIKKIEGICRSFLWQGDANSCRKALVAWNEVCTPKSNGGLGFRDPHLWNMASMGKLIWQISMKKDILWVKWVNQIYIKTQSFWDLIPKATDSWAWKQICRTKEKFRQGFQNDIWIGTKGPYSVSNGYFWLSPPGIRVDWYKGVWNPTNIPKHTFIAWLMKRNALLTKDKLKKWGIISEDFCPLCIECEETHQHLFGLCDFSKKLLQLWSSVLQPKLKSSSWLQHFNYLRRGRGLLSAQRKLGLATLVSMVYCIWQQRNEAIWNSCIEHPLKITKKYMGDILSRFKLMQKELKESEVHWLQSIERRLASL